MIDFKTLYKLWFCPLKGSNHAERLENFYASQVNSYDEFRKKLLWARPELLKACAIRLEGRDKLVWVDLGGGTGENVEMMSKYINLEKFDRIYIVDLCHSMCEKAKERVEKNNWKNVYVVESDACNFKMVGVDLVTLSYSLSMIPNYYKVVDNVRECLSEDGYIGVCDFGVKNKFEMSWLRRFFWRSIFDIDNIDVGPERREYLKYIFNTIWEQDGEGSIVQIPYFRAPYYSWIGRKSSNREMNVEYKEHGVEVNHPSFLYNMSWEDPKEDEKCMKWDKEDRVLTLTGGGCNIFDVLLKDVKRITAVDINKAQTALVELKMLVFKYLDYESVWKMFGEGYYEEIEEIYNNKLKYYISNESHKFWKDRLWYFKKGLYNQGGMGKVTQYIRYFLNRMNINLLNKGTLEGQIKYWEGTFFVKIYRNDGYIKRIISRLLENEWFCWFGLGVPKNQLKLIEEPMYKYLFDTLDPLMRNIKLEENYFYYNIFAGKFTKETCPEYLKEENYEKIKERVTRIELVNNTLLDELSKNRYTKVILMDHLDWMDERYAEKLKKLLIEHIDKEGLVQWRSASIKPFYLNILVNNEDFMLVHTINRFTKKNKLLDKVNMYAHYSVMKKLT